MHYFVLSHFLAINKKKQESLERPTLYIYYEYYQSSIQKVLFIEFFFCGGFKQVFFCQTWTAVYVRIYWSDLLKKIVRPSELSPIKLTV